MKKLSAILVLITIITMGAYAQSSLMRLADEKYLIDSTFIADTTKFVTFINDLADSNERRSVECGTVAAYSQRMLTEMDSLQLTYGNDSTLSDTALLSEYASFRKQLLGLIACSDRWHQHYIAETVKQMERERQEHEAAERKAALEREQRLVTLKEVVKHNNLYIEEKCSGEGLTDKNKIKELKILYYSYLSVYNRYNLSSNENSEEYEQHLDQLANFQQHLKDSVMGGNAYPSLIENFRNTLKIRAGKDHSDVYKSYCRVYQTAIPSPSFSTLEEYRNYINNLQSIIEVQNLYIKTVEQREKINAASGSIEALYSKADETAAYRGMLSSINMVPAFSTIEDGNMFVKKLCELNDVQQIYIKNYYRLKDDYKRADSIYSEGRRYADLTAAFRMVQQGMDLMPKFHTMEGYSIYNAMLSDYETVQRQYLYIVYIRDTMGEREKTITHASKTLKEGYKRLKNYTARTPNFNNSKQGEEFIKNMQHVLRLQEQCMAIADDINRIAEQEKEVLLATKGYSYTRRGYNTMMKTYEYSGNIATLDELKIYSDLNNYAVKMQRALIESVTKAPNETESFMKKEKDPVKLKEYIGVK